MTESKFTVGLHLGGTRHSVTVIAEDALMAALKVKLEQPNAAINFVRRCNKRGDLRHPHDEVAVSGRSATGEAGGAPSPPGSGPESSPQVTEPWR